MMTNIKPHYLLFLFTIILVAMGIAMIASSSVPVAREHFNDPYLFLKRQLCWAGLGLLMLILCMYIDYHFWQKFVYPIFIFSILLLVLVLFPGIGRVSGGARRWISYGPISFQPVEMAKITLIIYLSATLARKKRVTSFSQGFLPYLLVLAVITLLVIKQPNFSNAIIIGVLAIIMLYLGGVRMSHLCCFMLSILPLVYFLMMRAEYRKGRILGFLNPYNDPLGKGFQIVQSFLALGSGGITGMGLGGGRQKLFYLPAAHTDFIFAIIGEELGFLGTSSIVILFLLFLWQGIRISLASRDDFGRLLSAGITLLIVLQAFINMSVVSGFLPVTGITLPFLSFGGSSLIFTLAAVGILLNVSRAQAFRRKR